MFTERQQEIIDVSVKLISEKGIQNLTIKNISSAISVTERAIYRHFKSKQEIMESILILFKKGKEEVFQKMETENLSPLEIIDRFLEMTFANFSKKPYFAALLFSEELFRNNDKLAKQSADIMNASLLNMESYIKKGQKIKEIRKDVPAKELSFVVLGTVRLSVLRWHIENYNTDIIREGKKIRKTVKRLLANH